MAAQQPARASPELRVAPLSPRYRRNYTTCWGTIFTPGRGLLRNDIGGNAMTPLPRPQQSPSLDFAYID